MIRSLAILLVCQLTGEMATRAFGLGIPGPVLGLVLLVLVLLGAIRLGLLQVASLENTPLGKLAATMLGSMGILFVPAGVGVVQQSAVLMQHGLLLLVVVIGSTLITMVVTVAAFVMVKKIQAHYLRVRS